MVNDDELKRQEEEFFRQHQVYEDKVLRDKFAISAFAGVMTNSYSLDQLSSVQFDNLSKKVAKLVYQMADAMVQESKKYV